MSSIFNKNHSAKQRVHPRPTLPLTPSQITMKLIDLILFSSLIASASAFAPIAKRSAPAFTRVRASSALLASELEEAAAASVPVDATAAPVDATAAPVDAAPPVDAAGGAWLKTDLAPAADIAPSKLDYGSDIPDLLPPTIDMDTISLVVGQENYGLAVVAVGEALWSFFQAPSLGHAKILIPAAVSALVLVFVSGPMVTSGDPASIQFGLEIATGVTIFLGLSYVARLLAPYSPSPKEIAFLGLLVSLAGFFSFSQNLVVDGFISLPQLPAIPLPSIQLPSLPSFDL